MEKFFLKFIGAFYAVFAPTVAQIKKVVFEYETTFDYPQTVQQVNADAVEIAKELLTQREGFSLVVYPDPIKGDAAPTVGIGHLVRPQDGLKMGDRITPDKVDQFFQADIQTALNTAVRDVTVLDMYTPKFLAAMISVSFQLGDFRAKGFGNTFERLKARKFTEATNALKQSAWYAQTPKRVNDFIDAIEEYRDEVYNPSNRGNA